MIAPPETIWMKYSPFGEAVGTEKVTPVPLAPSAPVEEVATKEEEKT
jgi:hypothetical protein